MAEWKDQHLAMSEKNTPRLLKLEHQVPWKYNMSENKEFVILQIPGSSHLVSGL